MRDHPYHFTEIQAGMWGIRLDIQKELIDRLWHKLIDQRIIKHYNPYKPNHRGNNY